MTPKVAALALPEARSAEHIELRAIRLFYRWKSKDRPGLFEYASEQLKDYFRAQATLRVVGGSDENSASDDR